MARCSKCDIDKEASEFSTYYHSTQYKLRTRKVCKSCFYLQKKQYKESIKNKKIIDSTPVSVSPTPIPQPTPTPTPELFVETKVFIDMDIDTKVCFKCKIDKPVTDFYIHSQTKKPFARCKECELEMDNERYRQQIEDQGGSDRVRSKCGQWIDEYQRENVEGFLKVIGWKHNGKHWYKEGVRSGEDGVWEKMRGLKKYRKPMTRNSISVTDRLRTQIEDIIKLRESGEKLQTVASIYSTSVPTLYKVINEYYEKKETR